MPRQLALLGRKGKRCRRCLIPRGAASSRPLSPGPVPGYARTEDAYSGPGLDTSVTTFRTSASRMLRSPSLVATTAEESPRRTSTPLRVSPDWLVSWTPPVTQLSGRRIPSITPPRISRTFSSLSLVTRPRLALPPRSGAGGPSGPSCRGSMRRRTIRRPAVD